jgi:hypothetical protein
VRKGKENLGEGRKGEKIRVEGRRRKGVGIGE